jgi:hypothetical protein
MEGKLNYRLGKLAVGDINNKNKLLKVPWISYQLQQQQEASY